MSKLTKLLSVFVIASTVTAGVAALAGCHTHTYDEKWSTSETQHWHAATCAHEDQKKDLGDHVDANDDGKCDVCGYQMEVEEEHTHTYSNEWTSDATQHWHAATCEHTDQKKDAANHVDANEDGKCDVCGYQMQTAPEVEGIPAPEGTSGLIIEKTTTTYTLSAASPTVDISTADLKVYYADDAAEGGSAYGLGIAYNYAQYKLGFFPSLGHAFEFVGDVVKLIFTSVGQLFTGDAKVSETLGGTVSAVQSLAELTQIGFYAIMYGVCVLSASVAIMNILPFPALDGCKVIFCLIEWIRGKPINRKIENIIHFAGLIFLLLLAIILDLVHFLA